MTITLALAPALPRPIDRDKLPILPPHRTPMRLLNATELATIRLHVPHPEGVPEDPGGVCAVAHRLAVWQQRGYGNGRSGWAVACGLQWLIWTHSHNWRKPLRGLDLLRLLDATAKQHNVEVTIDLLGERGYGRTRLGALPSVITRVR